MSERAGLRPRPRVRPGSAAAGELPAGLRAARGPSSQEVAALPRGCPGDRCWAAGSLEAAEQSLQGRSPQQTVPPGRGVVSGRADPTQSPSRVTSRVLTGRMQTLSLTGHVSWAQWPRVADVLCRPSVAAGSRCLKACSWWAGAWGTLHTPGPVQGGRCQTQQGSDTRWSRAAPGGPWGLAQRRWRVWARPLRGNRRELSAPWRNHQTTRFICTARIF